MPETIYLTAHITGAATNPANATGAPNGVYTGDTAATSWTSRWSFGTPTAQLDPGTQTVVVRMRKDSTNTGTPSVTFTLYENGVSLGTIGAATNITSSTSQDITVTFNGSQITDRSKVELQIAVTAAGGGPSVRATGQVDSATWTAVTSPAGNVAATTSTATASAPAPAVSGGGGGATGTPTLMGTSSLYENASGTDVVLSFPAGIVSGELLLVHLANSATTIPTTGPAGWTLAASANNPNASPSAAVWYKFATGSETGTVTFTVGTAAGRITGIMERWASVDSTTPMDATPVTSAINVATTFVMPSITTVTANAMLVHTIALNAATSADIVTLAGTTLINKATGTGRRMGAYYELQAAAGASGTRTWTETPTTTALQWTGITVALRPGAATPSAGNVTAVAATATAAAPSPVVTGDASVPGNVTATVAAATAMAPVPVVSNGAGPTPVLNRFVQGIPGTITHVIKVNTTDATSVRIKVGTDTGLTAGVLFGTAGTPDVNGNTELSISGLTAGTLYYCRIAMTNSVGTEFLDALSTVGQFTTDTDTAQNFTIAFGSCTDNTDSASMSAIAAKTPTMFLHLGDEYYADASGTTVANFRAKMDAKKTAANHLAVLRTAPCSYVPSDHDGMNNNTNAGTDATAWANYNSVYREMHPNTGLAASGVYKSFKRGRVRFIAIDRRSFASPASATDDATKTSLGATQKQWFKDQITNATEPVIIVQNPDPWIGTAVAGDDAWLGYTTERTELANHIAASGKNVVFLGGDMHALAAEDGTGSPGGVPIFHASPFYQTSSQKGGPYTVGPYPTGAVLVQQYGWIDVTDSGTQISLAYKGFSSDNTLRVSLTKTYTIPTPANVSAIAATGTASAPATTLAGSASANVSAVNATATSTAPAPALSGAQVLSATAATATASAPAPVASGTQLISTPAATATAAAPAPTVLGAQVANVAAVTATGTASAPGPVVTAVASPTSPAATGTAAAPAPSVNTGAGTTLFPPAGTATAGAPAPVVVGEQPASVIAAQASGTADAPAPVVTAQATASVTAVASTATSAAAAPVVLGEKVATVTATLATASAVAPSPIVAVTQGIQAITATATAQAPAPVISAPGSVQAVKATATAAAPVPTVFAATAAGVTAVGATATSSASAPSIAAGLQVVAVTATASGIGRAPFISAGGAGAVSAVTANATAAANPPVASVPVTVIGACALGTAGVNPPALAAGSNVAAAAGSAAGSARAPVPSGVTVLSAVVAAATGLTAPPMVSAESVLIATLAIATARMLTPLSNADKEMYLKDGTRVRPYILKGGILVPVEVIP